VTLTQQIKIIVVPLPIPSAANSLFYTTLHTVSLQADAYSVLTQNYLFLVGVVDQLFDQSAQ
jgi:hypothetical protein